MSFGNDSSSSKSLEENLSKFDSEQIPTKRGRRFQKTLKPFEFFEFQIIFEIEKKSVCVKIYPLQKSNMKGNN